MAVVRAQPTVDNVAQEPEFELRSVYDVGKLTRAAPAVGEADCGNGFANCPNPHAQLQSQACLSQVSSETLCLEIGWVPLTVTGGMRTANQPKSENMVSLRVATR